MHKPATACIASLLFVGIGTSWMPALAERPPAGPQRMGWYGPGNLCEKSYTLKVINKEFITVNNRDPWEPVSHSLHSPNGMVVLDQVAYWPPGGERGKFIESRPQGSIHELADLYETKRFIFIPKTKTQMSVAITVYSGWFRSPVKTNEQKIQEKTFNGASNRLDFSSAKRSDCLNRKPAGPVG